nr:C-C chemokine receptor type 8-like [Misgurnus anguillicaudatus]
MNNSPVNFPGHEASINSTASLKPLDYVALSLYSLNLVFGLPTHIYVIHLIITGAGSGIVAEFLMLNLSICENGICLNCLIVVLSIWFTSLSTFNGFLIGFSITGRPLFQCLICVERYLAVVHPVTFLKYKPVRYKAICCAAAWIICLGSCLFCMFTITSYYAVYVCCLTVQLFVFLSIKLFCLSAVLRALKQSGPGKRGKEGEEENHMKRRAFNLILITTVTTVISYGPLTLTGLYNIKNKEKMNNSTVNFTSGSKSIDLMLTLVVNGISLLFGLPTHPYIIYLIITGAGNGIASEFSNLNLSVSGLGITARPLFQCLICVERYLAVVHPVTFLNTSLSLAQCLICVERFLGVV